MRNMITLILLSSLLGVAVAGRPIDSEPVKAPYSGPQNVPVVRQGGDTILDAVEVTLPVVGLVGTTAGYSDDYDEECPYAGGGSPDVVYTFVADASTSLRVDLCGSSYDTKVYVYDQEFTVVGCNDDFYPAGPCGQYVSLIYGLPVSTGMRYYVVVDGYGGDFGDYVLTIAELDPCNLECPAGAELEGEPPLTIDYTDEWNGGCEYSTDNPLFQPITATQFCGKSGMYLSSNGSMRDTDWFELMIPAGGTLEITIEAEHPIQMWQIGTEDCIAWMFLNVSRVMACEQGAMTISGEPGESVLLWITPRFSNTPDGSDVFEFDYSLTTNLSVRTESQSLSEIKAIFR